MSSGSGPPYQMALEQSIAERPLRLIRISVPVPYPPAGGAHHYYHHLEQIPGIGTADTWHINFS